MNNIISLIIVVALGILGIILTNKDEPNYPDYTQMKPVEAPVEDPIEDPVEEPADPIDPPSDPVDPPSDPIEPPVEPPNNEPANFKFISEFDGTNPKPSGWWQQNDQNRTVENGVLKITYPKGHPGGYVPWRGGKAGFEVSKLYFSFRFKVSENWQFHPSGVNKLGFFTSKKTGNAGDPGYINLNSQTTKPYVELREQGRIARNFTPNLAEVEIKRGQWYFVEALVDASGGAELWVNGVKTTEYNNINWTTDSFDEYKLEPTWGGVRSNVSEEMYLYIDHIYLSGQ